MDLLIKKYKELVLTYANFRHVDIITLLYKLMSRTNFIWIIKVNFLKVDPSHDAFFYK